MSMGTGQAALDLLAQDATTEELTRDEKIMDPTAGSRMILITG